MRSAALARERQAPRKATRRPGRTAKEGRHRRRHTTLVPAERNGHGNSTGKEGRPAHPAPRPGPGPAVRRAPADQGRPLSGRAKTGSRRPLVQVLARRGFPEREQLDGIAAKLGADMLGEPLARMRKLFHLLVVLSDHLGCPSHANRPRTQPLPAAGWLLDGRADTKQVCALVHQVIGELDTLLVGQGPYLGQRVIQRCQILPD